MSAPSAREGFFVRMQLDYFRDPKWKALRKSVAPQAYTAAHTVWCAAIVCSMRDEHAPVSLPDLVKETELPRMTVRDALDLLAKHELATITIQGRPKPVLVSITNLANHQVKLRKKRTSNDAPDALNDATRALAPDPEPTSTANASMASFNDAPDALNASMASFRHPIEARAKELEREERVSEYTDTLSKTASGCDGVCVSDSEPSDLIPSASAPPIPSPAVASETGDGGPDAAVPGPGLATAGDLADLPPETAPMVRIASAGGLKAPTRMSDGRIEYVGLCDAFGRAFEAATKAQRVPRRAQWGHEAFEMLAFLPGLILPEASETTWNPKTHGLLFTTASFDAATTFATSPWAKEHQLQRVTWPAYVRTAVALFALEVSPEILELKKQLKAATRDDLRAEILDRLKAARYGTSPHGGMPQNGRPATPQSVRPRIEPAPRHEYRHEGFK